MFPTKKTSAASLLLVATVTSLGVLTFPSSAAEKSAPPDKPAARDLTADQFDKLQTLIKPDPKRSFETIPWTTSLWQARQKAAAEDKPIVLWSGDPNPLGVT
jgi:hypothetical protein